MPGSNQHYIPQFFLRGFGIPPTPRPTHVWAFSKGGKPSRRAIKGWASDEHFNSEPAADGSPTLDDHLGVEENRIAKLVDGLRQQPLGSLVDAGLAASIVHHLAPRTAHIRQAFTHAMAGLADGITEVFGDAEAVKRLLGLDERSANERFTSRFAESLERENPFRAIGIPQPLLEKIAFQFAREQYGALVETIFPSLHAVNAEMRGLAGFKAREGHIKAMADLNAEGPRFAQLAGCAWTTHAAPPGGAVMPDCVALAYDTDGVAAPYMLAEKETLAAIVMPLAHDRLLVGTRDSAAPLPAAVNRDSAECSSAFFVARTNAPSFAELIPVIGVKAHTVVDVAMDKALEPYRAPAAPEDAVIDEAGERPDSAPTEAASPQVPARYEVSFLDCADEKTAQRIAAQVRAVVNGLARWLPLQRLEGLTFAQDYATAVRGVDRGVERMRPAETVDAEVGLGVAMTICVVREGQVTNRIVAHASVGHALDQDDEAQGRWALRVLAYQLALVALTQHIESALPGCLLQPVAEVVPERWLYGAVHPALQAYYAARESAAFAEPEALATYRQLAAEALARAKLRMVEYRRAYRLHGDLDRFIAEAVPLIERVLTAFADLYGHEDGLASSPAADPSIAAALEADGLTSWADLFREDLRSFADRVGRWRSFDEFSGFISHAERLLWLFGVFPWRDPGAGDRIDIPLLTDAEWLTHAAPP